MKAICTSLLTLGISTIAAHAEIPAFQHVVIIQQTDRTPAICSKACVHPRAVAVRPPTRTSTTSKQATGRQGLAHRRNSAVAIFSFDWLAHRSQLPVIQQDMRCRPDHRHLQVGRAGDFPCKHLSSPEPCHPKPQFTFVDNSTGILNPYLALATLYGGRTICSRPIRGQAFPLISFSSAALRPRPLWTTRKASSPAPT